MKGSTCRGCFGVKLCEKLTQTELPKTKLIQKNATTSVERKSCLHCSLAIALSAGLQLHSRARPATHTTKRLEPWRLAHPALRQRPAHRRYRLLLPLGPHVHAAQAAGILDQPGQRRLRDQRDLQLPCGVAREPLSGGAHGAHAGRPPGLREALAAAAEPGARDRVRGPRGGRARRAEQLGGLRAPERACAGEPGYFGQRAGGELQPRSALGPQPGVLLPNGPHTGDLRARGLHGVQRNGREGLHQATGRLRHFPQRGRPIGRRGAEPPGSAGGAGRGSRAERARMGGADHLRAAGGRQHSAPAARHGSAEHQPAERGPGLEPCLRLLQHGPGGRRDRSSHHGSIAALSYETAAQRDATITAALAAFSNTSEVNGLIAA